MPRAESAMRCPTCGGEMNQHAEKLVVTSSSKEPGYDPALGGYLEQNHTCPGCGALATRRSG